MTLEKFNSKNIMAVVWRFNWIGYSVLFGITILEAILLDYGKPILSWAAYFEGLVGTSMALTALSLWFSPLKNTTEQTRRRFLMRFRTHVIWALLIICVYYLSTLFFPAICFNLFIILPLGLLIAMGITLLNSRR